MTRQWLAPPRLMCKNHLLGEHAEAHMFLDKMMKHFSLDGYRDGSMFFGAGYILARHNLLAEYIPGHQTPLVISDDLYAQYPDVEPTTDDIRKSLADLLNRCGTCYEYHMRELE